MNDIYVGKFYTWNWIKMIATGGVGNCSEVYALRWNSETNHMDYKDLRDPSSIFQPVEGYEGAIEVYKNYIAEHELLC